MFFNQTNTQLVGYFNMIFGGSLEKCAIFGLGLSAYINASIVVQILSKVVPSLEKIQKEGTSGRIKLNQYTRYGTLGLAIMYSFIGARFLVSQGIVENPNTTFYLVAILTFVTGTMTLMWLGEQMTERGIGNGTSLIICAGILSSVPKSIIRLIEQIRQGQFSLTTLAILAAIVVGVTSFIVLMERAQRKIPIQHPQRQQGRRMYAAQLSYLPLKINIPGIMPTIFSSVITMPAGILFPSFLNLLLKAFKVFIAWFKLTADRIPSFIKGGALFAPGQPLYMLLVTASIIFFSFFFTSLMYNPREVADNLKKSGAFIPGIRPGEQSAQYIDQVMTRLTAVGSIYLAFVVLLPDLMVLNWKVPFAFGGTALLIIIVVVMELIEKIQSLLMSYQYESLVKKAKLKGMIN
jgi:preprotein translocase subunit SecY